MSIYIITWTDNYILVQKDEIFEVVSIDKCEVVATFSENGELLKKDSQETSEEFARDLEYFRNGLREG